MSAQDLRNSLALIYSLANDTTADNWQDKRLYVLQTCVRMSDTIAALEAQLAEAERSADHWLGEARRLLKAGQNAAYSLEATPLAPKVTEVRPLDDWHEDCGYVVWWTWGDGEWLGEPSYIGSPLCDDWPGYHTHWSPHPPFPSALAASQESGR